MTDCAVVVSYNRKGLLEACLSALCAQQPLLDEIIVVDNASTDGSVEMIRSKFPNVKLRVLETNRGGSGGFQVAVQTAIQRNHSFAWLMDDDARPLPDAHGALLRARAELAKEPSFLASLVVDESEDPIETHVPVSLERLAEANGRLLQIDRGSFVGFYVNLEMAAGTWLPLGDFFIYHDDLEYSSRLAIMAPAYLVSGSLVQHPDKRGEGLGDRIYYDIRNRIWIARSRDLASEDVRRSVARPILRRSIGQSRFTTNKIHYFRLIVRAWCDGVLNSPGRTRAESIPTPGFGETPGAGR